MGFRRTLLPIVLTFALLSNALPARADAPAAATGPDETPAQVRLLLDLLGDPAVREWLEQYRQSAAATPTAAPVAMMQTSATGYFAMRVGQIREHIGGLVSALPRLPAEFERAAIILSHEFQDRGLLRVILLIVGFVIMGFGVEWLYQRAAAGTERRILESPMDTANQRLRANGIRFLYGTGLATSFAAGSIGAFLAFDWPPLLREIVLGYLLAFLALRLALVAGRLLLAPRREKFRIMPIDTPAAWYWYRHLGFFVGWLAFGWVTVGLLTTLGFSEAGRQIVAYTLGLGLLAVGLEIAWRRPAPAGKIAESAPYRAGRRGAAILLSSYFVLLWLFWVASDMPGFWLAVFVVGLPVAMRMTRAAVNHIVRPADAVATDLQRASIVVVGLERGLRALLIIGATLLLARAWHVDLFALTETDTLATRLLRGALNAVVILLVADVVWHMVRALIDHKFAATPSPNAANTEESRRAGRLRTLLPILRSFLLVLLLVISVLMVLSTMGVQIAPLIAGAGVVGVAIGFGAQTLVKDVISGAFYLLDDAFRIGEYIQSGSYKGTVESFSLRSVKLRHHRGPLFTVPFGILGAVENMSRDWVIDKITIGITYDSDLGKAKKIIKDIGKALAEDPEHAPHILEPLKMQGVEQFGDFAVQIRMKMMTRPGEQFVIRRKAYAMIKKAFDENGIKFAYPTVQVAGGGDVAAAAAARAVLASKPPPTS